MMPDLWASAMGALQCRGSVPDNWEWAPNDTEEAAFALDGEDVDAMEAIGAWAEVLTNTAAGM